MENVLFLSPRQGVVGCGILRERKEKPPSKDDGEAKDGVKHD